MYLYNIQYECILTVVLISERSENCFRAGLFSHQTIEIRAEETSSLLVEEFEVLQRAFSAEDNNFVQLLLSAMTWITEIVETKLTQHSRRHLNSIRAETSGIRLEIVVSSLKATKVEFLLLVKRYIGCLVKAL